MRGGFLSGRRKESMVYRGKPGRAGSKRRASARGIFLRSKLYTGANKPGRNEPCPCGSGLKFKKCHGSPTRSMFKQA